MRTHLEARRTSVTSRRRGEEPVVSPVNDEINKNKARLEKLAARNTEAAQSTSTSPFSMKIQQVPLPAGFRMRPSRSSGCLQRLDGSHPDHNTCLLQVFCSYVIRDNQEMDPPNRTGDYRLLGAIINYVYALIPKSP